MLSHLAHDVCRFWMAPTLLEATASGDGIPFSSKNEFLQCKMSIQILCSLMAIVTEVDKGVWRQCQSLAMARKDCWRNSRGDRDLVFAIVSLSHQPMATHLLRRGSTFLPTQHSGLTLAPMTPSIYTASEGDLVRVPVPVSPQLTQALSVETTLAVVLILQTCTPS